MKSTPHNPLLRRIVLASAMLVSISASQATNYQWDGGGATGSWANGTNWNPNIATAYPTGFPDFNKTGAHRLNVNSTQKLVYSEVEGTTVYANTVAASRGLVIGSGSLGSGTMEITGGTFSTVGSTAADVIGNTFGNTGTLILDGGNYISTALGTTMGIGGGPTSNFSILAGKATITNLIINTSTANIDLNGGTLEVNAITPTYIQYAGKIRLNGGTLKPRQTNSTFLSENALLEVLVQSGGAIIDTSGDTNTGVNVTIAEALLEDSASTGGGLTKKGSGLLTLSAPSTISGAVTVEAGGLGVKAGSSSWTPSSLTHSGDTLNVNLGVYNPANPAVIDVADLTLNTTDITVNISGSSIPAASEIKILDYGTKSGSGSLTLNIASLPTNMVATLEENTIDGYYYLNVTSPSATAFTWSGDTNTDGTGNWDTTSLNWNANVATYVEPALASFPDITGGGTVTVSEDVSPITFDISNTGGNTYTFEGSGKITGNTGITKSGTGIVKFNGAAHTYSGNLAINAGAVIKQVADDATGNITVAADGVSFVLDGGITDGAGQTLTISGRGALTANTFFAGSAVQRGALQAHNGANTWEGDIVLASSSTSVINRIGVQDNASLTLTGTISESVTGAPLLFRAGAVGANITLGGSGAYTYTGQTQIFSNGATIILGETNKLPTTSYVFFGSGGSTIFDLNGFDQEFAGLNGNAFGVAATILNNGTAPSTLTTTLAAAATAYLPSLIKDGTGTVSFVKNGEGTQTLAGNNTYSGTTTINAGRLDIQEFQSGTGDVFINGGSLKLSYTRTLASGVNMSIASGAFFYLDGSSQTLGKLEGAGIIDSTYANLGVDTLTVGANDQSSTFDGLIQQSTARTYALKKIGTGTLTLTGLNTYTGNTTVEDGTLSVAQSNFADTSTVTLGSAEASPAVLNLPNAGTDIVAALIIDGVSQPGNGAVYHKDNTGGAITGDGQIQVGTVPPAGYTSWASDNSVTQGETGDDDGDGIINLVEYALGLDPQVSNPSPGTLSDTLSGKLLSFTKSSTAVIAGDVTYFIETSTTLAAGSWTEVTPDVNGATIISFTLPSDPSGKIFARLKVVK